MKVINKSYNIELSENELATVVDALQLYAKTETEYYKSLSITDKPAAVKESAERLNTIKPLRNELAAQIGRFFMGADA